MKATIKCRAVLACALHPFAVITAKVGRGQDSFMYVWLDENERGALREMLRDQGMEAPRVPSYPATFPDLVRGHAIDAETGAYDQPLSSRPGNWMSAEGLWVNATTLAKAMLESLERYRREHPQRDGSIAAPNWLTLTAVRALALAVDLPDPGINDNTADRSAS